MIAPGGSRGCIASATTAQSSLGADQISHGPAGGRSHHVTPNGPGLIYRVLSVRLHEFWALVR
jgi:hypothetical protein